MTKTTKKMAKAEKAAQTSRYGRIGTAADRPPPAGWPIVIATDEGCAHESTSTADGNGSYCRFCGETVA